MSQVLSPDEVNALLSGIQSGEVDVEGDQARIELQVEPFDFSRQERVAGGGDMPVLYQAHDRFCRGIRAALSAALRRALDVRLAAHDTLKFGEFMKSAPFPSSLHVFRLEPLKGLAVCIIEGKLVFTLIDHFFGGGGARTATPAAREFTPIEQRIIRMVMDLVLTEYGKAWQPVTPVKISYVGSEINPQFINVVPGSEPVARVEFDIEVEDNIGKLKFCLPYSMLEPLRERLKNNFQGGNAGNRDAAWPDRLGERVKGVGVNLRVDLGTAELTGRQLLNLKPGDIVTLNGELSAPLKVYVEEIPKYHGFLGTYHGSHAIKIDQALAAQGDAKHGRKTAGHR